MGDRWWVYHVITDIIYSLLNCPVQAGERTSLSSNKTAIIIYNYHTHTISKPYPFHTKFQPEVVAVFERFSLVLVWSVPGICKDFLFSSDRLSARSFTVKANKD